MELSVQRSTSRFFVKDHSFVGTVRRAIRELAERKGFGNQLLGRLDLLSTELATNLAKHATSGGEIFLLHDENDCANTLRMMCVDRGPGIADVQTVLTDGFSTAGSMGAGLGSLKRLSDAFEISSAPGKGTVLLCTLTQREERGSAAATKDNRTVDVGAISVPHFAEERCGDGVSVFATETRTSILVVDGLGHGPGAADTADRALAMFAKQPHEQVMSMADKLHKQLTGSRGAAMALLQIDHLRDRIQFVGVGNITARIYSRYASRGCVSVQGVVGGQLGSLKEFTYEWEPGATLLMYSDGIKSDATVSSSGIKSALLEAGEIYRDFCRMTDDTSVVVVKDQRRK